MKNKLNKIAKDTNIFLKNFLNKQHKSKLIPAMKYGLFPGGKKIRSKILIDIGSLLSINYKTLIAIGAAVECIHAYSLIHDDLPCMDNDKMRRGKPSTHIKFGESNAILAGNSIFSMAINVLIKNISNKKNDSLLRIIELLCNVSGLDGLAKGQSLDLEMQNKKISIKKMLQISHLKTSKLFEFCVVSPFILSKSSKKYIKEAKLFSHNLGLIFQITDDMIDLENKNYQKMNNFCIQLIRDCTKKKTFFGERNGCFHDFLYHILNRRM